MSMEIKIHSEKKKIIPWWIWTVKKAWEKGFLELVCFSWHELLTSEL